MALRLSNDKEKESEFSRRVHNTQGHSQRGEREKECQPLIKDR